MTPPKSHPLHTHYKPIPVSEYATFKGIWPEEDYMFFLKLPQTFKVKQKQS